MDKHLDRHFEEGLTSLRNNIIHMGSLVESMLVYVVKALFERDMGLFNKLAENEEKVDRLQIFIDEECLKLIALHQPMASDLRFLLGVSKINAELERVGDHATSISRKVAEIMKYDPLKPYVDMPKMFEIAHSMFKESLETFVNLDVDKARIILIRDNEVNRFRDMLVEELTGIMMKEPSKIPITINLIIIANLIEKIADHATNIAEVVVFVVQGKDIRHNA